MITEVFQMNKNIRSCRRSINEVSGSFEEKRSFKIKNYL